MKHTQPTAISAELVLRLQATVGNRAVQRLLERRPTEVEVYEESVSHDEPISFQSPDAPQPNWWRQHLWWPK